MALRLTDDDSGTYDFPTSFYISSCPLSFNKSYQHRTDSQESKNVADGQPLERTITLVGKLGNQTRVLLEADERDFCQAVLKGGYLTDSLDPLGAHYRRIDVRITDMDITLGDEDEGLYLFWNYSLAFTAKYGFWEDTTATNDINVFAGNDTFSINFSGSDYEYRPIITVDADQAANLPTITLSNTTDGRSFTYTDAGFLIGSSLVVDCAAGTVELDGSDTIDKFIGDANFLRLLPKNNNFSYTGNAATVTVTYRKVYVK